MLKKYILFIPCLLILGSLQAQDSPTRNFNIGVEAQQYPTGFLLGVRSEIGWKNHHALNIRVGYNLLDHQDFGVHEEEIGGGFGFTLGYSYYFKPQNHGWFLGVRNDFWFNEVDWKDNIGEAEELRGTSNIIVLQPTIIGGYQFLLKNQVTITPTLAFGAEINIKTEGEEVGQGSILLWGLNLGYQF